MAVSSAALCVAQFLPGLILCSNHLVWSGLRPALSDCKRTLLKPFPITPGTIRLGKKPTAKGYYLSAFEDSFMRYLSDPPSTTVTPSQPSSDGGFSDFPTVTPKTDVTVANPLKAAAHLACDGVTVENPPDRAVEGIDAQKEAEEEREAPQSEGRDVVAL